MADAFEPTAQAAFFSELVADTRSSVGTVKPPSEWEQLWTTQPDGTVVNRRGETLREPIKSPSAKP